MSDTYTCAACNSVFDKGWSDEEALAEKEDNWGDMSMDDMEIVCDDCYRKIMGLPQLGEKEE